MSKVSITADDLSKDFNRRPIFRGISFSLSSPSSLAITGKNGAGKSTLSKILAGLIGSTRGSLTYTLNDKQVSIEEFKHYIGFVSPYLNLYDEFTALENLQLLSRIRTTPQQNESRMKDLLSIVNLWQRRDDLVGTFSSGMKQRLKYAFALLHNPIVLILDEPTSNLDEEGSEFVQRMVKQRKEEGILIVATNDKEEAGWCAQNIHVGMPER
ncbi:MAG: ABC transporter ATP-binding protein [Bacteroidota bacterium]|jgi:heme exporter protein A